MWDTRKFDTALLTEKLDTSPGIIKPIYDQDTNLIYICGKV